MAMAATPPNATTSSIISLVMDEVRQSLEPKISHILTDYQTYKETHDALLKIPFIKHLLDNQCKCHATQVEQSTPPEPAAHDEPIHLEIIDGVAHGLPNLDSIAEYINATIDETSDHETVSEEDLEAEEATSEAVVSETEEEEEEEEEATSEAVTSEAATSEAVTSEAVTSEADQEEEDQEEEDQEEEDQEEEEEDQEEEEEEEEEEATSEAVISEAVISEAVISEAVISEADQAEVDQAEVDQEEVDQEEEEATSEAEEEELELFEVEIKGKTYVTNDEIEGDIYEYANDEVGEIVGTFKNGVAKMIKKPKSSQKK